MRKSISTLLSWPFGVAAIVAASASFAEGGNVANGKTIFTQGKG